MVILYGKDMDLHPEVPVAHHVAEQGLEDLPLPRRLGGKAQPAITSKHGVEINSSGDIRYFPCKLGQGYRNTFMLSGVGGSK